MKPAKIAVICIAAVSAIGLALVVRAMGSSGEPTAVAVAAVETRPMAKVLVAAKDLEPGRRLADSDLSWKDWPVDELNPVFITDGSVPVPAAAAPERRRLWRRLSAYSRAIPWRARPGPGRWRPRRRRRSR
jgi:pilus assembly protein CpaB